MSVYSVIASDGAIVAGNPAIQEVRPSGRTSIRPAMGTPEADTLSGTDRGDLLDGGAGNDTLFGGDGDDTARATTR